MAHCDYYSYKGTGEDNLKRLGYNQAVRLGRRIEISGQGNASQLIEHTWFTDYTQGGWHHVTAKIPTDINEQIDQAFFNVDHVLKDAGGKGWPQVFKVVSYHLPLNNEAMEAMTRNFKKWMHHQPLWTCVGVTRLGRDDMRVEIEVVADDDAYDSESKDRIAKVSNNVAVVGESVQLTRNDPLLPLS